MPRKISPEQLIPLIGTADCPLVVDVRREQAFRSSPTRIAGAIWRDHMTSGDWSRRLAGRRGPIVVYCVHGHNVSALAASLLAADGRRRRHAGRRHRSLRDGRRAAGRARGAGRRCHAWRAERLGDARAAEDRSHRLPVADPPLHRSAARSSISSPPNGSRTLPTKSARSRSTSRTSIIRIAARPAASTR